MPRPPHTLSRSTPSCRAAVKSGVPTGTRPRFPDGVKTTRGSVSAKGKVLYLGRGCTFVPRSGRTPLCKARRAARKHLFVWVDHRVFSGHTESVNLDLGSDAPSQHSPTRCAIKSAASSGSITPFKIAVCQIGGACARTVLGAEACCATGEGVNRLHDPSITLVPTAAQSSQNWVPLGCVLPLKSPASHAGP